MEFTTLDQIEAHFQPLISAAGDDASRVMQLRLERADARDLVRDRQDQERALTDARAAALQEFPYARQEELRGSTAAEVAAAAKASHEHVTAILQKERDRQDAERNRNTDQSLDQQGRQAYGRGGAGGGTGEPPAPPPSAFETLVGEHQSVIEAMKGGMPFEFKDGLQQRTQAAVLNEMADVVLGKNIRLLDRGKATSAEESRIQRGGVQFE